MCARNGIQLGKNITPAISIGFFEHFRGNIDQSRYAWKIAISSRVCVRVKMMQ